MGDQGGELPSVGSDTCKGKVDVITLFVNDDNVKGDGVIYSCLVLGTFLAIEDAGIDCLVAVALKLLMDTFLLFNGENVLTDIAGADP